MKKIKMITNEVLTFAEGCNLYLDDCRKRNLREATINHYRQSYAQFYKFINKDMPVNEFDEKLYSEFVIYLKRKLNKDVSINSYLRDLITTLHFLMREGYVEEFKMQSIKVDKDNVSTYTENELQKLLQKPNLKKCKYIEYQSWVITNFLFTTGARQRSMMNIKINDIDFDNNVVKLSVTKNRKALIVPISIKMADILKEFLKHRNAKNNSDWLFCNVFGEKLVKSTCYNMLCQYNRGRGVETTGIHRYRHTFAKQWILNGGNVVVLSQILGHSNLSITQNYINLLVSDVSKQVEEINLLDKFTGKKHIKM